MKTKYIILTVIFAVIALGTGVSISQQTNAQQNSANQGAHEIWYCPMHPQIQYDHPGTCPICGMNLIKKGAEGTN